MNTKAALFHKNKIAPVPEQRSHLRQRLLAWYDKHGRTLPWRVRPEDRASGLRPDPYAVWLSEIMLQQTTVAAVRPYWQRFMTRWPSLGALAAAELNEVLTAWAGLGYYARARRLHACAVYVRDVLGGVWPRDEEGLRALPGIGPYTAAAIAALVFDLPANVVDGNVERVMSRLYAVDQPLDKAKKTLKNLAGDLITPERPGDYAQALMDLGATVCTPRKPLCMACPWREFCKAYRGGAPQSYPVKSLRAPKPERFGIVFWLEREGHVFLRQRPEEGLLGGMMEMPSTPWRGERWSHDEVRDHAFCPTPWDVLDGRVRHVFTHFSLELQVWHGKAPSGFEDTSGLWAPFDGLDNYALPSVMKKIARFVSTKKT